MALIQCEDCGQQVSDKADACPNCGAPIARKIICTECGTVNDAEQIKCIACNNPFVVAVAQTPSNVRYCTQCKSINTPQATYCIICGCDMVAKPVAKSIAKSTQHISTDPTQPIPENLRYFNWGAFFLWPLWGFGNGCWWLFFIPLGGLFTSLFLFWLLIPFLIIWSITAFVLSIIFGINGNSMAWRHKRWDSVDHFKSVQHSWGVAGVIIFIVGILMLAAPLSSMMALISSL